MHLKWEENISSAFNTPSIKWEENIYNAFNTPSIKREENSSNSFNVTTVKEKFIHIEGCREREGFNDMIPMGSW